MHDCNLYVDTFAPVIYLQLPANVSVQFHEAITCHGLLTSVIVCCIPSLLI